MVGKVEGGEKGVAEREGLFSSLSVFPPAQMTTHMQESVNPRGKGESVCPDTSSQRKLSPVIYAKTDENS